MIQPTDVRKVYARSRPRRQATSPAPSRSPGWTGQRQRVGIARALATESAVLLCDEPTSALGATTTRQTPALIRELRDRLGIIVVIITHAMSVVSEVCDSVTLLGHGRVMQYGSLDEVVTQHGCRPARELIPVPELPVGPARSLVEVTYATDTVATLDSLQR